MHNAFFTVTEKSIAVLPFENIGSDKSEEYISDGITQDVISNLSKISSLQKVIGWFSVRGFKKTSKSVKEIADEIDVAAILSGTIEKEDQKTRIRTELTEVGTNKLLWVDNFEYTGGGFLSIQSKVALHIANTLIANLTPEERKGLAKNNTENPEAYKLYRKGRGFWEIRDKANYDSAELYFNKALALDSGYALAYSGLADCYTYNQKGLSQLEAIPISEKFARKALSLDSTLTEAKTTLAFFQCIFYYHFNESAIHLRSIISENPNYPTAHLYYSNALHWTGHYEEAMNELRKELSLDPLSPVLNMVLARNYLYEGKPDSAFILINAAISLNPGFRSNYVVLGLIFMKKQLYQKAIDVFARLPQVPFDQGNNGLLQIAYCYLLSGDIKKLMNYWKKLHFLINSKVLF